MFGTRCKLLPRLASQSKTLACSIGLIIEIHVLSGAKVRKAWWDTVLRVPGSACEPAFTNSPTSQIQTAVLAWPAFSLACWHVGCAAQLGPREEEGEEGDVEDEEQNGASGGGPVTVGERSIGWPHIAPCTVLVRGHASAPPSLIPRPLQCEKLELGNTRI